MIGIGANLDHPADRVRGALKALAGLPESRLEAVSGLYRSVPVDAAGPDYFNAVARVQTCLTAPDLLRQLQRLEFLAGRQRPYRNAPRTLDLDLLFFGDASMASPALTLPHPRWRERAFVLWPLAELVPARVNEVDRARVADQPIVRVSDLSDI